MLRGWALRERVNGALHFLHTFPFSILYPPFFHSLFNYFLMYFFLSFFLSVSLESGEAKFSEKHKLHALNYLWAWRNGV